MEETKLPWYRELNRYHWFVLIVAALGWLFDCLDQQLFILARQPAMKNLLQVSDPTRLKGMVDAYAGCDFDLSAGLGERRIVVRCAG